MRMVNLQTGKIIPNSNAWHKEVSLRPDIVESSKNRALPMMNGLPCKNPNPRILFFAQR